MTTQAEGLVKCNTQCVDDCFREKAVDGAAGCAALTAATTRLWSDMPVSTTSTSLTGIAESTAKMSSRWSGSYLVGLSTF